MTFLYERKRFLIPGSPTPWTRAGRRESDWTTEQLHSTGAKYGPLAMPGARLLNYCQTSVPTGPGLQKYAHRHGSIRLTANGRKVRALRR
jgi:hypothetical protein